MKSDNPLTVAVDEFLESGPSGRSGAFEKLIPFIEARLFAFIYRYSPNEASDLLQETLILIWKGLPSLRNAGNFLPWAYKIARNVCVTHIRREAARKTDCYPLEEVEAYAMLGAKLLPDGDAEMVKNLCEAIGSLTEEEQSILTLHYFDRMSWYEVGIIVGKSENAVRMEGQRIRTRLHLKLQKTHYAEPAK